MRDLTTAFTMTAAAALMLVGAGCSQGPADESPESAAMEYRQSLMHVQAFKLGALRGMADGTIDADVDVFAEYAADLAATAGMITDGFALASSDSETLAGSDALPDIWGNWDDFVQKAADLESAADGLARQASAPGFTIGPDSAAPLGPACGGCHRVYRQPDE